MYYKFLNLGSKILTGLCFCAAMSSCGDTNSGNNSSNFEQSSPSTDVSSLQNALSKENISGDKVTGEDLKMYEEMSKTIPKEEVEKLLIQNYQKCEKQAGSDVGKRKELFRKISQQCQACATAVALYSEGKTIYSQAEDRWTLYKNIFPEFSKMWSENNNIDKKGTVEICLNRLKNNNKKIVEHISKISMTLLGILQQVDINCTNVITDVTKIGDSLNTFKENFNKVLQSSQGAEKTQEKLSQSLDEFSSFVTRQVELASENLYNQSSTLNNQLKQVKAIRSIVNNSKKTQDDTNELLGILQKTVAKLEKELQKNTQVQDPTNKKHDKSSKVDNSSEAGQSTDSALDSIFD